MKKIVMILCLIVITCISGTFVLYKMSEDQVIKSLGTYKEKEFYSNGGFQDATDYAKYAYDSNIDIEYHYYLKRIEDDNQLLSYINDFESVVEGCSETSELVQGYDFNRKLIDSNDYYYIDMKETTFDSGLTIVTNYTIYFYDIQSNVLYYFHHSI